MFVSAAYSITHMAIVLESTGVLVNKRAAESKLFAWKIIVLEYQWHYWSVCQYQNLVNLQ